MENYWQIFSKTFVRLFDTRARSYNQKSASNLDFHSASYLEPIFFSTTLIQRTSLTHDTDWYTFSLPSNIFMSPPIGYHIRLRTLNDGLSYLFLEILFDHGCTHLGVCIVKPYTVVKQFLNNEENPSSERTIELLIKHYPDRLMTPILQRLNIGKERNGDFSIDSMPFLSCSEKVIQSK